MLDLHRIADNFLKYHESPSATHAVDPSTLPDWRIIVEDLRDHLAKFEEAHVIPRLPRGASTPTAPSAPKAPHRALRVFLFDVDTHHGNGTQELIAQCAAQRGLTAHSLAYLSPYLTTWTHRSWCDVCSKGGELLICESCPRVSHWSCDGLNGVPDQDWYCLSCRQRRKATRLAASSEQYDAATVERNLQCRYKDPNEWLWWRLPWQVESTGTDADVCRDSTLYYHSGPAQDVRGGFVRPRAWDNLSNQDQDALLRAHCTQWSPCVVESAAPPTPIPSGSGLSAGGPQAARERVRCTGPPISARPGAPSVAPPQGAQRPVSAGLSFTLSDILRQLGSIPRRSLLPPPQPRLCCQSPSSCLPASTSSFLVTLPWALGLNI